jgi:predicted GTPase
MLGYTGSGKSTLSNTLIGQNHFMTSNEAESCTSEVSMKKALINGNWINVIDVPGFGDSEGND